MKIGILGWGSLCWDPRTLNILDDHWSLQGPELPIEFARISVDKRLTLVILPGSDVVRTLYAISTFQNLDEAIEDLRTREGTSTQRIGFYNFETSVYRTRDANRGIIPNIQEWNKSACVDAVIWTDLPDKFVPDKDLTLYNIEKFLLSLTSFELSAATEYIEKTPIQVQTTLRGGIQEIINTLKI